MLPSSINFQVKLVTFAFVQTLQARTLDRADVDESVRLAIVTNKEAEALHRIEEFDCTGCALASQLALRRRAALFNGDYVTNNLQILRGNLAAAINQVELQFLTFSQTFKACPFNRADMNEDVFSASFLLDEAKALLAIEELHNTLAGADNLRWHTVETTATTAARPTTAAATWSTATAAEAIATARAAIITKTAPTAAKPILLPEIVAWGKITATAKWIEAVLAKTVPFVPAPAAPSIVTHNLVRTLSIRPISIAYTRLTDACAIHSRNAGKMPKPHLFAVNIAHNVVRGEQFNIGAAIDTRL